MDKKKIIIIIIVVLILGVAAWMIFKKSASKTIAPATSDNSGSTSIDTSVFPLKLGSKGAEVTAVQRYLNSKYNAGLTVDGIWGIHTNEAAVKYLNRDNVSIDVYQKWNLS